MSTQTPIAHPTGLKEVPISTDIGDFLARKTSSRGFEPVNILRYPRLDTVLMVENAIRKAKDYPTKAQLYRSLPKKTMYQTFNLILDYLEYSGKIIIDKDGAIIWVWNPDGVAHYMKHPELHWKRRK